MVGRPVPKLSLMKFFKEYQRAIEDAENLSNSEDADDKKETLEALEETRTNQDQKTENGDDGNRPDQGQDPSRPSQDAPAPPSFAPCVRRCPMRRVPPQQPPSSSAETPTTPQGQDSPPEERHNHGRHGHHGHHRRRRRHGHCEPIDPISGFLNAFSTLLFPSGNRHSKKRHNHRHHCRHARRGFNEWDFDSSASSSSSSSSSDDDSTDDKSTVINENNHHISESSSSDSDNGLEDVNSLSELFAALFGIRSNGDEVQKKLKEIEKVSKKFTHDVGKIFHDIRDQIKDEIENSTNNTPTPRPTNPVKPPVMLFEYPPLPDEVTPCEPEPVIDTIMYPPLPDEVVVHCDYSFNEQNGLVEPEPVIVKCFGFDSCEVGQDDIAVIVDFDIKQDTIVNTAVDNDVVDDTIIDGGPGCTVDIDGVSPDINEPLLIIDIVPVDVAKVTEEINVLEQSDKIIHDNNNQVEHNNNQDNTTLAPALPNNEQGVTSPTPIQTDVQLLTPISPKTVEDANAELLGKLFTQTEQLYKKRHVILEQIKAVQNDPTKNQSDNDPQIAVKHDKKMQFLQRTLNQIDRIIQQTQDYTQILLSSLDNDDDWVDDFLTM